MVCFKDVASALVLWAVVHRIKKWVVTYCQLFWRTPSVSILPGIVPFCVYSLSESVTVARVFFCSIWAATTVAILMVSYKFLGKTEKPEKIVIARCGALCSQCSFFKSECPSCPEGDTKMREQCSIFLCSLQRGLTCRECGERSECTTYINERGNCPFEKEIFSLQIGVGYVIHERNPERSVYLFKEYVNRGDLGLLVSRQFPEHVQSKFALKDISSVWLSTAEGSDIWIDPCNLSKLHHVIAGFIRKKPVSTVLLEGFEYLMVRNSFLTALKFVQSLMDEIIVSKSRLILSINPDAFSKTELALIRRELEELK